MTKPWDYLIESDASDAAFIRSFRADDIRQWDKFFKLANRSGRRAAYRFVDRKWPTASEKTITPRIILSVNVPNETITMMRDEHTGREVWELGALLLISDKGYNFYPEFLPPLK